MKICFKFIPVLNCLFLLFKLNILFDFFILKYLAAVLGGKLFFAGSKLSITGSD